MLLPDNVNKQTYKQKSEHFNECGWEIKLMRKLRLTAEMTSGVVCA